MKISLVVITLNEEKKLEACLRSAKNLVSEMIVVDAQSQDSTVEIARKYKARVFKRKWTNFSDQKNFANSKARFPWILSLDADERISPELNREIQAIIQQKKEPECSAFSMPRLTYYLGRWIRHSGWYPDRKIRLFKKNKVFWEGEYVHEKLVVDGEIRKFKAPIYHFTYENIQEHMERINIFSELGAQKLYARQKKTGWYHLTLVPFFRFFKSYFLKAGFLDGFPGLVISVLHSYAVFARYAKLREIWKKGERIELFPD